MKKTCLAIWLSAVLISACTPILASTTLPPVDSQRITFAGSDGSQLVPTSQLLHPAGESVQYNGRPVDIVLSPDARTVYVMDDRGLLVIDAATWKIRQSLPFPEDKGSFHGMTINHDGTRVYASSANNNIWVANVRKDGMLEYVQDIVAPPGPPGPSLGTEPKDNCCVCGIALSSDEKSIYACLSRNNELGVFDLASGKLTMQIPVGVAPYHVALSPDGSTAYVSNWAGRHPAVGKKTSDSSGTPVEVDDRNVVSSGTVSVVDLKLGKEVTEIDVELHPSDMRLSMDGSRLYVANANSDTVSVIDTRKNKVVETILVRPDPSLPFGSAPNALELSKDGKTLFVANGGNNAVAVVSISGKSHKSKVRGFIPTAWYPAGLATDGHNLFIADVNGLGARFVNPRSRGFRSHSDLGVVSRVPIPEEKKLAEYSDAVKADSRVPEVLRSLEAAQSDKAPVPVPERVGEPSVFEHVLYIIKENKTYDQMFGDLPRGNNELKLCIYGKDISPNHHALAQQFVQLDNYYCNSIVSADGHCWATEGNATDYMEKAFGAWPRSYGSFQDCMACSSTGMIWDDVLAHGLSFRNYGEMGTSKTPNGVTWSDVYHSFKTTGKVDIAFDMANPTLRRYTCTDYAGWELNIPDVVRASVFTRELADFEKKGSWPNFVIAYLPDDHTSGGTLGMPTPRAQVADNDLALGRIVEAVSKSKFWAKTCIFVEEDDPQSGFDHVDGHRSICLVASPYTKRGALVSQFYSQTSVLHTIERILGLPPMTQLDAMAPVMTDCFTDKPDMTPYKCAPNVVPLDEMSLEGSIYYGKGSKTIYEPGNGPFDHPDAINDDEMNRVVWYLAKGPDSPYPAEYAGAHGKGLAALGLKLDHADSDDKD